MSIYLVDEHLGIPDAVTNDYYEAWELYGALYIHDYEDDRGILFRLTDGRVAHIQSIDIDWDYNPNGGVLDRKIRPHKQPDDKVKT